MCMNILPAYMSIFMYYVHAWCPGRQKEVFRALEIRVINSCELSCGCPELNSGPVQEYSSTLDH